MFVPDVDPAPATIHDVARLAGVSASTVSRVFRGAANVLQPTRERVMQAAAELGYVPSPAASRLASGRTRSVAVIVPFATRWFFAEVIRGVESVLRDAGYDLLLYIIGEPAGRMSFFETMPLRRRVDGVLAVSSEFSESELVELRTLRVPIVCIGSTLSGASSVGIDDSAGAAMAVRHLIALGHRDIAMICGHPDDPIGRATTLARRAGYISALSEAGITGDPDRIVRQPWGVAGGARAMEYLLGRGTLPSAVFAESDEMALGALQTLRKASLEVPRNISVIGFDDHEMAAPAELTTIAQPVVRQGELAAQLLLGMLGGSLTGETTHCLPVRLVVRGSTGPPPATVADRRDGDVATYTASDG